MLTITYVVYKHHLRKDGLFGIRLRITKDRQSVYLDTIFTAMRNQLSRDLSKIKDAPLARQVSNYVGDIYDCIHQHYKEYDGLSAKEIKAKLRLKPIRVPNVAAFWRDFVADLRHEGRDNTASNYSSALNRFLEYTSDDKTFNDIDRSFLIEYQRYLEGCVKSRGVELYMSCLRKVYNAAYERYSYDIPDFRKSPFETYSIPPAEATQNRNLDLDTIAKILSYVPVNDIEQQALDSFKISLYLCGINTCDIYALSAIADGRITYNRNKTKGKRKDHSLTSVAWPHELDDVLVRHRGSCGKLFNFCARYSTPANYNKAVGKGLRSIKKKLGLPMLQFYCARHTFATLARDLDVSFDNISLALVHSRRTVTDIYIKPDFSKNDTTSRTVIDAVEKALRNLSADGVVE